MPGLHGVKRFCLFQHFSVRDFGISLWDGEVRIHQGSKGCIS